jgi:hypothetical protein
MKNGIANQISIVYDQLVLQIRHQAMDQVHLYIWTHICFQVKSQILTELKKPMECE